MVCSHLLFEEPAAIYVPLKFAEMVKDVKLAQQAKKVSGSLEEKRIGERCHHLHTAWHKCVPFKIQSLWNTLFVISGFSRRWEVAASLTWSTCPRLRRSSRIAGSPRCRQLMQTSVGPHMLNFCSSGLWYLKALWKSSFQKFYIDKQVQVVHANEYRVSLAEKASKQLNFWKCTKYKQQLYERQYCK